MELKNLIRDVADFPKEGILFKDITPLLQSPQGLKETIKRFVEHYKKFLPDVIVAVESRGFIFGAAVAAELDCGFVPVRKPGKLPYKTISETYDLEYGTDTLTMHVDAITKGQKVVIIDDLLATGGTIAAAAKLVELVQGRIIGLGFVIELDFLKGREKIKKYPIFSMIHF